MSIAMYNQDYPPLTLAAVSSTAIRDGEAVSGCIHCQPADAPQFQTTP